MRRGLVAAAMTALACAAPAGAAERLPWPASDADSRARSEGRGSDQLTNPVYRQAQDAAPDDGQYIDPLRRGWSGTRGVTIPVTFANRYGARLAGHLYRPRRPHRDAVTGRPVHGPLPGVVLLPGLGNWDTDYAGLAQQIAENGYVVLTVEPQGQHLSEPDPSPKEQYCGETGDWREPQEAGLVERGPCAGQDPPNNGEADMADPRLQPLLELTRGTPAGTPAVQLSLLASLRTDPAGFFERVSAAYEIFRPRFTFAGIDAGRWLRSPENPWRERVDADRIGIVGHSAGADGAVVAANAAERGLFDAAVAWDTYGTPPAAMALSVPTMLQQAEQAQFMSPWSSPPDPEFWPAYRLGRRLADAGVPSYLVALRGSTHQEWPYIPDSFARPLAGASSKGQQVALHYTVAWLDRWLKGSRSRVQAADARHRLTADRFDASADRTSIGTGTYDPIGQRNVPPRIGGDPFEEHLSHLFRTKWTFDGMSCADRFTCDGATPASGRRARAGLRSRGGHHRARSRR